MIPTIGLVISGYVVFRVLEILLQGSKRYGSRLGFVIAIVVGVLVILATGASALDLLVAGRSGSGLQ